MNHTDRDRIARLEQHAANLQMQVGVLSSIVAQLNMALSFVCAATGISPPFIAARVEGQEPLPPPTKH